MNMGFRLILLPLAVLAGGADARQKASRAIPVKLETMLQQAVESGSPGLSAAVADCRGVLWTGVAGAADITTGRPIDRESLFGIGSITKVFVAVTTLQLVEEGRLKLTDTPASILGEQAVAGIANADSATIADLLGHRSGVPSWEDDPNWIRKGRGAEIVPAHIWGKTEALDYIRGTPATGPSRGDFGYSNSGYTILGLIIEKVTGHTAEAEIRRRVLSPLGLSDTYMEGFEAGQHARVPRRYQFVTPKFRADAGLAPSFAQVRPDLIDTGDTNLSDEWVAGGFVSSTRDLVAFGRALSSGRLLKPESLAFMEQWGPAFRRMDHGHGLFLIHAGKAALIGHTGGVLGFSAALWWSASGEAIVAVLGNGSGMHAGPTPRKAAALGLDPEFVELAVEYVKQKDRCRNVALSK